MAFFKLYKGVQAELPVAIHEGYAYFCTDTGNFYLDFSDTERRQFSGEYAEKLRKSDGTVIEVDTLLTADDIDISSLDVYTKAEIDQKFQEIDVDVDAYTKAEIDQKLSQINPEAFVIKAASEATSEADKKKLLVDTADSNILKYWNGTAWVHIVSAWS